MALLITRLLGILDIGATPDQPPTPERALTQTLRRLILGGAEW
jgi:hypothetical protein